MEHIHLIGIGGSGLSAIARLLLESGNYTVSGSDKSLSSLAAGLANAGVTVYAGHDPRNIEGADLVVRSSAIPDDNPEVVAARAAGIPVLKRADFLGRLMVDRIGIAVAGTHGKTTTTAMIAWILVRLGLDPCYIIGGVSKDLGGNAHAGQGRYFVIEADEYDRMFLGLLPDLIVVTNLEHDHPDCFPTPADYRAAFVDFLGTLKPGGQLLACIDDQAAASLLLAVPGGRSGFSYGLKPYADYFARNLQANPGGAYTFDLVRGHTALAHVNLQIPGEHNVQNAVGALAVIDRLGLPIEQAAEILSSYSGTGRRFDLRGEAAGVAIIDDYAHHPTQIRTTLAAARGRFPGRTLWAVWQPHTYSRTQALLNEYAAAFHDADHVLVTEVYAAREAFTGFSARQVVERMEHPDARFIPGLEDTGAALLDQLKPGDVVLVLSAGDADSISARVLQTLREKEGKA